ncbi:MAG: hypothetical protein HRU23_15285 [Gammaproteobacteria bacterium]|nr:hypothetical protein [Gammaproteobacteria bacterium]
MRIYRHLKWLLPSFILISSVQAEPILTYLEPWQVMFFETEKGGEAKNAFGRASTNDKQITNINNPALVAKSQAQVSGGPGTVDKSASGKTSINREFRISGCPAKGCSLNTNGVILGGTAQPGFLDGELILGNPFYAPFARVFASIGFHRKNRSIDPTSLFHSNKSIDQLDFFKDPLKNPMTAISLPVNQKIKSKALIHDGDYNIIAHLSTFSSISSLSTLVTDVTKKTPPESTTLLELYQTRLIEIEGLNSFEASVAIGSSEGKAESNFFATLDVEFSVEAAQIPEPPINLLFLFGLIGLIYAQRSKLLAFDPSE